MKKLLALFLALVMSLAVLSGCKKSVTETASGTSGEGVAFNEMGNMVEDSSDLPDWTGKKFELTMWYGQGTGAAWRLKKAENDVVSPELYRVTGIKYSDKSFDNGGELMDARIAKIMAVNDWPDVVVNPERAVLEKMIEAGMVYDLTDLIPKYCTNITAMANKSNKENFLKSQRKDGKIYALPTSVTLEHAVPDLDRNIMARAVTPTDPYDYVYVRDDILRMLYPQAKKQDEIESIFMQNGGFTKEEIMDVPINSKEDFFDFLYKIKRLGIKEGNREVYPFYVAEGIDNWALLTTLGSVSGYNTGRGVGANYFTYWDKETKKVEYMFAQPFFKEVLRDWTRLVQDNIAAPDSLIDSRAVFEEKRNNGLYAVLYGYGGTIDQNMLNTAGKTYKYRKVYLNIPPNTDKFLFSNIGTSSWSAAILKNQVKEEDLPQVLRFYDFAFSDAGQKLANWGPRSAGLWTEENGKRVFSDKELEANLVYDVANDKKVYYNLTVGSGVNSAWPGYPATGGSRYNPKVIYDFKLNPSMANKFFSVGVIETLPTIASIAPNIWLFDGYGISGVQKFWQARQAFEDSMTKIFISKNDEEFEKLYNQMVALAKTNGLTDEVLEEINTAYRKSINVDYMFNLE
ncbi:MAG: extracellular solute-binding protein [Firmicutes bacterium]|nr:extracellular solute-binding protein [Bacillota bacterium]